MRARQPNVPPSPWAVVAAAVVGGAGGRSLVVIVVVAIGAAAFAVAGVLKRTAAPGAGGGGAFKTSTAVVARRTLVSQTQVNATLEDAGSYSVVNQATGTLTRLPAVGRVVRQGQALYQVDGLPVVLLYGNVPAWRTLSAGMTGRDVRELNAGLVRLGYATAAALGPRAGWDYFSSETAYALGGSSRRPGDHRPSAKVTLGQVVFLPTAAKISAWESRYLSGGAGGAGRAFDDGHLRLPRGDDRAGYLTAGRGQGR